MTQKSFEESIKDGQAVYSKRVLVIYDLVVTHFSKSFYLALSRI